jgi:hypothetical protein
LKLTGSGIKSLLVIGACTADHYKILIKQLLSELGVDFVLFNNSSSLPDSPPQPCESYDFHFVVLPFRDIVTDRVVDFKWFNRAESNEILIEHALSNLRLMFDAALRYNEKNGILTFVLKFTIPSVRVAASLDRRGSRYDLSNLVELVNQEIVQLISGRRNVYLFDAESLGGTMGKRYFLDDLFGFLLASRGYGDSLLNPYIMSPREMALINDRIISHCN